MRNVYNFSAGPAVLPEPVLQEAADEMLDYKGSGMSVMEISHRSFLFQSIIDETEQDLRTLMNIPDDYMVLLGNCETSSKSFEPDLQEVDVDNKSFKT